MSAHFFIAPTETFSPRWREAFPAAALLAEAPGVLMEADYVWLLLSPTQGAEQISRLANIGVRVIAMTSIESPAQAQQALAAGAVGYVHYLAVPSVLTQVAHVVAAGGLWLGAELMRQLVLATVKRLPATPTAAENTLDVSSLTPRELAVAELVAAGKSNKEVARELGITERTVKAHLGASFTKLEVRDRLQLALIWAGKAQA